MTNPTSNYSFQMPTATDLVTDLPADFEVFGQAVDTRLKALQPGTTLGDLAYSSATANTNTRLGIGTTGQILSVVAGVPAWIANDQGDITEITAGTGITVTSPTGPVPTVSINTAVTADLTTAQTLTNKKLSDSTTTIVDATDATKAIKFDVAGTTAITGTIATAFTTAKTVTIPDTTGTVALTNGVINNTLTTTTGDIIYASSANTPARLGIGTTGQVLNVSGGIPAWATVSSGGMTSLASGSLSGSSLNLTSISGSYNSLRLVLSGFSMSSNAQVAIRFNGDASTNYRNAANSNGSGSTNNSTYLIATVADCVAASTNQTLVLEIDSYVQTTGAIAATTLTAYKDNSTSLFNIDQVNCNLNTVATVNRIEVFANYSGAYTFDAGTYTLWGIK